MGHHSWWGGFVGYMMHLEEHIHTILCNGICWAVDGVCTSFTAWLAVFGV
jgi:hypothetical protein